MICSADQFLPTLAASGSRSCSVPAQMVQHQIVCWQRAFKIRQALKLGIIPSNYGHNSPQRRLQKGHGEKV